jgi:hypothetical protein
MERRAYFGAPVQRLLRFARQPDFADRAARLTGYDVAETGAVAFCL